MNGLTASTPRGLTLPALPPITDPELRKIALTHKSAAVVVQTHVDGNVSETKVDYEKLAFVGDALLQAAVTCMLQRLFPDLPKGRATDLRSLLVRRENLTQIAFAYRLPELVVTSLQVRSAVRMSDNNAAEMFEAYVAGVYYSRLKEAKDGINGFTILDDWLDSLFTPQAELLYEPGNEEDDCLDKEAAGAKPELLELEQAGQISHLDFVYKKEVPLGTKGEVGLMWKTVCSARYRGKDYTRSIIRDTKKKGADGAAFLLLQVMWDGGLIRRKRWQAVE